MRDKITITLTDCEKAKEIKGNIKDFVFIGAYDMDYALYRYVTTDKYVVILPGRDRTSKKFQVESNFLSPLKWMDEGLYFAGKGDTRFTELKKRAKRIIRNHLEEIIEQMEELREASPDIKQDMEDILAEAATKEGALLQW